MNDHSSITIACPFPSGQESESADLHRVSLRYKTHILQSLRRVIRAVDVYSRKLVNNYQVTGPQLVCLMAISDEGPVTATWIAREVHLSPSTVVGILARLEGKDLIIRHRNEHDRRRVNVTLSDKGRELMHHAPSPLQDTLAQALDELNELEQATIALSLKRIVELMELPEFDSSTILDTSDQFELEPL